MLGSFSKMIEGDEFNRGVPQSLVDYLSESLPSGFHYELSSDGMCLVAIPDDGRPGWTGLKGARFVLDEAAEKDFGDLPRTEENLYRYLRNTQEEMKIEVTDAVLVSDSGEMPLRREVLLAEDPSAESEAVMFIAPPKLREMALELEAGGVVRHLHFKQQIVRSAAVEVYESDAGALVLTLTFDMIASTFRLNVKVSPALVRTANEYYETLVLFNRMMEGSFSLGGNALGDSEPSGDGKPRKEAERFWRKIVELEDYFGFNFGVASPLTAEMVRNACALHECLLNGNAVRLTRGVDSISGVGLMNEGQIGAGDETMLLIPFRRDLRLFDRVISCVGVMGAFNVSIRSVDVDGGWEGPNAERPFRIELDKTPRTEWAELYLPDSEMESGYDPQRVGGLLQNAVELPIPKGSVV